MSNIIEPLTGVRISSYIDPSESPTVIAIRSLGTISSGATVVDTPKESVLFGSGLAGGRGAATKKSAKNPQTIAEDRLKGPSQQTEGTYTEKMQSANPAYRLTKNAKSISKLHVKKYGKIPKTKKR